MKRFFAGFENIASTSKRAFFLAFLGLQGRQYFPLVIQYILSILMFGRKIRFVISKFQIKGGGSMAYKGLSSINRLEMRIYYLLGVGHFQKATLWLEKIMHNRDNKSNENYHPSSVDFIALERHDAFLLYNAFLHCVSLSFIIIYTVFSIAIKFSCFVLEVIMLILALLNIYCIILQRTNYLRLKEIRYKYYNRCLKNVHLCKIEMFHVIYSSAYHKLQCDYGVLSRIKMAFDGKKDCLLTNADLDSLKRISSCFEPMPKRKNSPPKNSGLDDILIEKCTSTTGPYTKLQMRADNLQRKLNISGRRLLDRSVVITENAECELYYRKLIPEDTVYNNCLVCFLLYDVYRDMMSKVGVYEAHD